MQSVTQSSLLVCLSGDDGEAKSPSGSIYPALEDSTGFMVIEPAELDKLVPRARQYVRTLQDQLQAVGE